jgi:hypothetical protein
VHNEHSVPAAYRVLAPSVQRVIPTRDTYRDQISGNGSDLSSRWSPYRGPAHHVSPGSPVVFGNCNDERVRGGSHISGVAGGNESAIPGSDPGVGELMRPKSHATLVAQILWIGARRNSRCRRQHDGASGQPKGSPLHVMD